MSWPGVFFDEHRGQCSFFHTEKELNVNKDNYLANIITTQEMISLILFNIYFEVERRVSNIPYFVF